MNEFYGIEDEKTIDEIKAVAGAGFMALCVELLENHKPEELTAEIVADTVFTFMETVLERQYAHSVCSYSLVNGELPRALRLVHRFRIYNKYRPRLSNNRSRPA